ncbi:MAG: hypothetical protein UV60_C0001G0009 [Parcubacteria group bacterium GW2011_GWA2_43_11]|nr:MAG: hypothetical protein UU89_C0006G0011 [Parcubacteria group bacterium GW2011_GWC2_42_11]KKS86410.1 MAG: hypothetical protein UV60_C0001G0009 [Parcubacteria group bacterium GW2011_GWA2_43_11]
MKTCEYCGQENVPGNHTCAKMPIEARNMTRSVNRLCRENEKSSRRFFKDCGLGLYFLILIVLAVVLYWTDSKWRGIPECIIFLSFLFVHLNADE